MYAVANGASARFRPEIRHSRTTSCALERSIVRLQGVQCDGILGAMSLRRTTVVALCIGIALLVTLAVISYLAFTERRYPGIEDINDKVLHVRAFGVLALLSDFSFPTKRFGQGIVLSLLGYGLLIEVIQYFLPYRSASVLGWIADGVGIAACGICIPVLKKVPLLRRRWDPQP